VAPQPGHAPDVRAQHRLHACTPQDAQGDIPIPASVAAGPIALPHRSQNGMDDTPDGDPDLAAFAAAMLAIDAGALTRP
jgi:hypothetical protein